MPVGIYSPRSVSKTIRNVKYDYVNWYCKDWDKQRLFAG